MRRLGPEGASVLHWNVLWDDSRSTVLRTSEVETFIGFAKTKRAQGSWLTDGHLDVNDALRAFGDDSPPVGKVYMSNEPGEPQNKPLISLPDPSTVDLGTVCKVGNTLFVLGEADPNTKARGWFSFYASEPSRTEDEIMRLKKEVDQLKAQLGLSAGAVQMSPKRGIDAGDMLARISHERAGSALRPAEVGIDTAYDDDEPWWK